MSLSGRIEAAVETNVPAEKIHDIFGSSTQSQLSRMSPEKVQSVDLLKGEWGKAGSTISWNFKLDGVPKVSKALIEDIDNAKLSVTFKGIEGDLMDNAYKGLKAILQATPKGQGSVVRWTVIYEKQCESVPAPTASLDFLVNLTKDINAHMTQAQA